MSLGTGLAKVKGKVFRIGHLGHFNDLMLMGTLAGVEMGLHLAEHPALHRTGAAAAMDLLAGRTASARAPRRAKRRISGPPNLACLTAQLLPHGDVRLAQRLRRETRVRNPLRPVPTAWALQHRRLDLPGRAIGVVVPRTMDDVARPAIAIAREHGVPVLPRGGGTSQCGQTVNRALVIDCTKHLRRVIELDAARRRHRMGRARPGAEPPQRGPEGRDGLFFPVDPSTHARCTIGGMAGNNSCGSKSIRYGLMADNVLAIDAILADGTRHRFGPGARQFGRRCRPDWPR